MLNLTIAILRRSTGKIFPLVLQFKHRTLSLISNKFNFFVSSHRNLSQNATKEKHRSAHAGIAGCVTPGGDFFVPNKGRPLLGCEKLLVQGLPYFRLVLGNESEVQLGDLAGNAMSVTVVSACMLAAITCRHLKSEKKFKMEAVDKSLSKNAQDTRKKNNREKFNESVAKHLSKAATLQRELGEKKQESLSKRKLPDISAIDPAVDAFKSLAKIARKAIYVSFLQLLFGYLTQSSFF